VIALVEVGDQNQAEYRDQQEGDVGQEAINGIRLQVPLEAMRQEYGHKHGDDVGREQRQLEDKA